MEKNHQPGKPSCAFPGFWSKARPRGLFRFGCISRGETPSGQESIALVRGMSLRLETSSRRNSRPCVSSLDDGIRETRSAIREDSGIANPVAARIASRGDW